MKQPIVFDIDGTLTSEPYNEDNLTTLRENSAMMLVALSLQLERPLVISTARPERFMRETEVWLGNHGLKPDAIFMRPDDKEGTPDHIIKHEHLKLIQAMYGGNPLVWVDDNDENIAMLKKHGIPVIHVNKDESD